MARELTMDVLLNPVVDTKAFDREFNKLQVGLRKATSGRHAREESLAARLIASMVHSGTASSETQARVILAQRMGGGLTQQQQAILRSGQNIAQVARTHGTLTSATLPRTFSESQLSRMRPGTASAYRQYRSLESALVGFRKNPTPFGALEIGGDIKSLRADLLKLYQEYRMQGRRIPDLLRQIAKNTTGMKKEIADFGGGEEDHQKSPGGSMFKGLGKLAGIGSLATILKKGVDAFQKALARGNQWLTTKAAYGLGVDIGDVRARAGIFNMSTEAAMSTSTYAADFRQRMLWGEVSEKEIIGLSRAGKWGRMVMSGEAARNPAAANAAFEQMVAGTDPAKMRSILGQLGLSQELMNYRIQGYSPEQRKEYEDKFRELAEIELDGAKMIYDAGNQYQAATEQLSADILAITSTAVELMSPQARDVYHRLMGNKTLRDTEAFRAYNYNDAVKAATLKPSPIATGPISGNALTQEVLGKKGVNIGQVTTNITVQGNADSNTVREMEDLVSKEASISNWFYGTAIQ